METSLFRKEKYVIFYELSQGEIYHVDICDQFLGVKDPVSDPL